MVVALSCCARMSADELAYSVRQSCGLTSTGRQKYWPTAVPTYRQWLRWFVDAVGAPLCSPHALREACQSWCKACQIVAGERGRAERKREHTGMTKNPLHDDPFLCWRLRGRLETLLKTAGFIGQSPAFQRVHPDAPSLARSSPDRLLADLVFARTGLLL